MNPLTPAVKIEIMQRSFRCFVRGLFSLLPVLGFPIAILALLQRRRVERLCAGQWNPAQRYLYWGTVLARLGLVLAIVEVSIVALIAAQSMP